MGDYSLVLHFSCDWFGFGLWRCNKKGLSSTPGKSVAKVARLLGENRHRLNQHRGYSEEVNDTNDILYRFNAQRHICSLSAVSPSLNFYNPL